MGNYFEKRLHLKKDANKTYKKGLSSFPVRQSLPFSFHPYAQLPHFTNLLQPFFINQLDLSTVQRNDAFGYKSRQGTNRI